MTTIKANDEYNDEFEQEATTAANKAIAALTASRSYPTFIRTVFNKALKLTADDQSLDNLVIHGFCEIRFSGSLPPMFTITNDLQDRYFNLKEHIQRMESRLVQLNKLDLKVIKRQNKRLAEDIRNEIKGNIFFTDYMKKVLQYLDKK